MKFIEANTRKEAIAKYGNSFAVCKNVYGGLIFFDTATEYNIWKNQK